MEEPASMSDTGMVESTLGEPRIQSVEESTHAQCASGVQDFLIRKDGEVYAGEHLLVDFWGGSRLEDSELMALALREAAEAADATVLHIHVHEFGGAGGVSGVAVLAESHISVHTWPELDYAAFDVFMCGNCRPDRAVGVLERHFSPMRSNVSTQKRGLVE